MKIPFTNFELSRRSPEARRETPDSRPETFRALTASAIVKAMSKRAYGAARSDRLVTDWPAAQTSANAEINQSAPTVRARNRQLERDNDWFRRALSLTVQNVVGAKGVRLQNKARDFAGKDDQGNAKFRTDTMANSFIEKAWLDWNRPENCTVMRNLSGVDLQSLIVRRFCADGGLLIRIYRGFNNPFRYALEPLEIDRLDFNFIGLAPNGNDVFMGLELDAYRAVTAYWVLTRHPGDFWIDKRSSRKMYRERVDVKDMLLVHGGIERAEQIFPMPIWTSLALRLWQLERFEESVQVASRVASAKGVYIKNTIPDPEYKGAAADQTPLEDVEPGMQVRLDPGEEAMVFDPKFPMDNTPEYIKCQIRGAASGSNLSSHALGNDASDVNMSAMRGANAQDREAFKALQTRLVDYYLTPIFEDWLPLAILSGQIALPIAKLAKFNAPSWRPRRWTFDNPVDDIRAAKEGIACRIVSREDVIEEQGGDMEEVDAQFAADPLLKDLPVAPAYLNNLPQQSPGASAVPPSPSGKGPG